MSDPARLRLRIKIGWAIGELGVATFVGITMIYMLFYLTQALSMPPMLAGVALLVPRLWDVLVDPVIGAISDRTRSRMGRRRPYLLAGGLSYGTLFALVFVVSPDADVNTKFLYVTALYLLSSTAYSLVDVPYSAMAAEMTTEYRERTALLGYKMVAARIGIVLSVTVGPFLFTSRADLSDGFLLLGVVAGAFMVVTSLVTFVTTRDAPRTERVAPAFNARAELSAVLNNRPFRILWLAFLAQNLAIGASSTTLVYLITVVVKADAKVIGPLIAVAAVVALLVTPVWVRLARRLGKRGGYFAGMAIVATMCVPALFIPPDLYLLFFGVFLISGIGDAATQLFPNSMVPDTVEVDELRTGLRREGAIFGAWSFCRKLGMAAGAFFVSIGLAAVGFVSGAGAEQTPEALAGIRVIYAVLPLALWIGAMLLLRRYDLTEARFDAIKAQIVSRADHRTPAVPVQ
jgi:GPH family glycoside/pentoside/hexuronide:cation symporter